MIEGQESDSGTGATGRQRLPTGRSGWAVADGQSQTGAAKKAVALLHAAPVRTLLGALVEFTVLDAVPDILDLIDKIEGPIG